VQEAVDSLSDAGNMYFFELGIDEDPLTILEKVRFLTEVYGCKYIFIDPIQQLSYGKTKDSTEEQMLSQISVQLERLATEFNVGIVVTSHVNDDGQTRSSRMIGKSASVRIDIKRDHMNPDPDVRNRTVLSVSKNRPIGPTGYAGTLVFDPETFILQEDI
jgi:replicative DNA helicase